MVRSVGSQSGSVGTSAKSSSMESLADALFTKASLIVVVNAEYGNVTPKVCRGIV